MIETTYLRLERAAEMLEIDSDTLLLAAAEGRIRLYGLLNQYRHAIKRCWVVSDGTYGVREENQKVFDFVTLQPHNCAEVLCGGDTGELRIVSEKDEEGGVWMLEDPGLGDLDMNFKQVEHARVERHRIFAKRADIEEIQASRITPEPDTIKNVTLPPHPTPRDNSLIATIAALLAAWPGGEAPSGKDLEKAALSVGVSISDDTIRKALQSAIEIAPSLPK